jgi:Spy/CpxP family protein refolding chaperone
MKHWILTFILAAALGQPFCAPGPAATAPTDPVAETLFDPELILHHGDDIGLTDEQREFLLAELHKAQDHFSELNQKSQKESEALATLLKKNPLDEPAVLSQFDTLMELERVTKRAHLTLMLTLKKKLKPEQQAKLQEIKQQRALIIARTGRPPDPHAALVEKMKKVEAGVQKWIDAGRDPSAVGELMQTFDGLTKQGKFKAAEKLIDRALQLLDGSDKPKK